MIAAPPGPLHEDGLREQEAFVSQKMALDALEISRKAAAAER